MARPTDTSPDAAAVQAQIFRRMTPAQRAALSLQMSDELHAIAVAGIEARHPNLSPEEQMAALLVLMLGPELAARVQAGR